MKTTPHTPEPWKAFQAGPGLGYRIEAECGTPIPNDKANVERIAACVNACEGIADPFEHIQALTDCREALKSLLAHGMKGGDDYRLCLVACKRDALNADELKAAERFEDAVIFARRSLSKATPIPAMKGSHNAAR